MSIGIIAAVSPEGIIGRDGTIPWHYSSDLKRFKAITMGATVIMGRLTWESLPVRPLKGRRNVVITSSSVDGVECFPDVSSAIASCDGDVWFLGGARIFDEAMEHADTIDLTYVPDRIDIDGAESVVYFPPIDESIWEAGPRERASEDERLERQIFRRRKEPFSE